MLDDSWHTFFSNYHDLAKPLKLQHVYGEMLVFAPRSLPFWHWESIRKSCFFKTPSGYPFCWFYTKRKILGPLQNPVGAQIEPKIDQVVPKTLFVTFGRPSFCSPDFVFFILGTLWLSFGTLLVPIGYLLLHFQYNCQWFFMFLAPTFEQTITKHAPSPAD